MHVLCLFSICRAFTVESGTDINRIVHFYWYTSFDERDAMRTAGATNEAWLNYVTEGRKHTRKQHSSVLQVPCAQPSPAVAAALHKCQQRAAGDVNQGAIVRPQVPAAYMLCTYQVPEEAVLQLLSSQTAMNGHTIPGAAGSIVFVGSVALGAAPGTIIELWRFPSAAAALQAQCEVAAASSNNQRSDGVIMLWRRAVMPGVVVKQLRVALLRPTKWSNMQ